MFLYLLIFWKIVFKKLVNDDVNVSSHCFEKYILNIGLVSGFLINGTANFFKLKFQLIKIKNIIPNYF